MQLKKNAYYSPMIRKKMKSKEETLMVMNVGTKLGTWVRIGEYILFRELTLNQLYFNVCLCMTMSVAFLIRQIGFYFISSVYSYVRKGNEFHSQHEYSFAC